MKKICCGAALLLGFVIVRAASVPGKQPYTSWNDYGGAADSSQYSALKQINKTNVNQLKLAWSIPAPGPAGRFSFNPLVVDGVMYVVGKDSAVLALDAATGKQIWSHPLEGAPTNRGFNYWESKDRSDRRIIFAVDSYLQEINAKTGVTINTFGNDGRVNLREGLGRDPKSIRQIQSGTPGRVFENLIILGSAPGEGYGDPPGDVRGYDVLTGKMTWIFHTIPHPGEFGYETWPPDAWKTAGGANTWGEVTIDEKRGIAYFPLGSPTYDLYGADRKGANLFGNCLLALDARTGKRLWHFQTVHHDLWDYDLTTAPKLLTVKNNGKNVDVVAQPGKTGFLYVFNRVTGEPLWPIEERAVPKSDMPGEESWPTQPVPTKPPAFSRQKFTLEDINPLLDAEEKAKITELVKGAANEGVFTPPTKTRNQIQIPGAFGGSNQGSAAVDPTSGMMFVKAYDAPGIRIMSDRQGRGGSQGGTPAQQGFFLYSQFCATCHGPDRQGITFPKTLSADGFKATVRAGKASMPSFPDTVITAANLDALMAYLNDPQAGAAPGRGRGGRGGRGAFTPPAPPPPPPEGQTRFYGNLGAGFLAESGLPAISPPWSELVAYDLNAGNIKWRVPLGTAPGLAAKGIKNTGAFRPRNGPVVTGGGLIFVGSNPDRMIHAFDKDTGKLLWETELEANPDGIPAVYEVGGRQFIAFYAAGGGTRSDSVMSKAGKAEAQGYYVFALPAKK